MSLLADQLLVRPMVPPPWATDPDPDADLYSAVMTLKARDAIQSAPIFVIDNVADYVWGDPDHQGGIDTGFIPPFPAFWMEYRRPAWMWATDRHRVRTDTYDDDRYGVIVYCSEIHQWRVWPGNAIMDRAIKNGEYPGGTGDRYFMMDASTPGPDGRPLGQSIPDNAKWIWQMCLVLQQRGGKIIGPVLYRILFVDEYGEPVGETGYLGIPGEAHGQQDREIREHVHHKYAFAFQAFEAALFFMNTRGIEHKTNRPRPKEDARWQKKKGRKLLTFKTLVVETVVGDPTRAGGGAGGGGSRTVRSEHIVRGHKADYRKGPGLFGKHKVLIYRAAHTAGSREVGAVVKDYEVRPPKKRVAT